MLKRASDLVPAGVSVGFLADRGFADTTWMRYLGHEWHGHCRMRVTSNRWIHRAGKGWIPLNQSHLVCGDVVHLQGVSLTKTHTLDNLHLALARDPRLDHPPKSRWPAEAQALANRFHRYWSDWFTFLSVPEVKLDNNDAERVLRPVVVHRKTISASTIVASFNSMLPVPRDRQTMDWICVVSQSLMAQ
jgi:hypothetical protein